MKARGSGDRAAEGSCYLSQDPMGSRSWDFILSEIGMTDHLKLDSDITSFFKKIFFQLICRERIERKRSRVQVIHLFNKYWIAYGVTNIVAGTILDTRNTAKNNTDKVLYAGVYFRMVNTCPACTHTHTHIPLPSHTLSFSHPTGHFPLACKFQYLPSLNKHQTKIYPLTFYSLQLPFHFSTS